MMTARTHASARRRPPRNWLDRYRAGLAEALRPARPLGPADRLVAAAVAVLVVGGAGGDRLRIVTRRTSGTSLLLLVGAIAMRGAGCTYNDLVDRDLDANVERTTNRPLPSGAVTPWQALVFLVLQALAGALVLLQFNRLHRGARLGLAARRRRLPLHEARHRLAAIRARPRLLVGRAGRLVGALRPSRRGAGDPLSRLRSCGRSATTRSTRCRTRRTTR